MHSSSLHIIGVRKNLIQIKIIYSVLSLSTTLFLLILLYATAGIIITITNITGRHITSEVRLKFHENIGRLLTNVFTAVTFKILDKSTVITEV